MNRLRLSRILMAGTILLLAAFQAYWLKKLYHEECNALQRRTDILLKETVQQIQSERMKSLPFLVKADQIERVEIITGKAKGDSAREKGAAIITTKPNVLIHHTDSLDSGLHKLPSLPRMADRAIIDSLLKERGGRSGVKIILRGIARNGDSNNTRELHFREHGDFPPPPMFNRAIGQVMDSLTQAAQRPHKSTAKDTQNVQRFVYELSRLDDSISLSKLDTQYRKMLTKEHIQLTYQLHMVPLPNRKVGMDSIPDNSKLTTRFAISGFNNPYGYYAVFDKHFSYISKKLLMPFGVSVLLIGFTVLSFVFIYRNLLTQRRLADMKNEFISNITHELKTPVATVNVAIEALRNFNALQDPERTREYLDISAIELQRLNLLIDKVLRLSMFENHTVDLRIEQINIQALIQEIIGTMRLQSEKAHAAIHFSAGQEPVIVEADRLHLTSVIYNLLDNAIKYSAANPDIYVLLQQQGKEVMFTVSDNGIGIPAAYLNKIFEKFFRVPYNDRHNARGYGLGLSYVAHIVQLHKGSIQVDSEEGKGSTFTIKLPLTHEQD